MEELAEATLLESLEENFVHEDHMEPQDDDAAGPVVAPVTDLISPTTAPGQRLFSLTKSHNQ